MGHKQVVLVVDDDKASREILATALIESGYMVEVAANGEEALRRVSAFRPDVVLTDLRMPGMSGLELIRAFEQRGIHLPVLVLTGAETMSLGTDPGAFGAAGCLRKPVRLDELLWAIDCSLALSGPLRPPVQPGIVVG